MLLLMNKLQRLIERPLAHLLRKCFKISYLRLIGGGKSCDLTRCSTSFSRSFPVLFVLCLLGMASFFASCEKEAAFEGYPEMYDYYVESCGLGDDAVDTDSITRFSRKVDAFVDVNPDAKDTSYYPLIQSNIKKYSVTIVITIEGDGAWDGATSHHF